MIETTVGIDGMQCGMCESHINDTIRAAFSVKKVTFRWDSAKEHIKKLEIEGSLKNLQNEKYKKSKKQIGSVQAETVEKIKKIMMQLYNLKKSDIQIEVE